MKIAYFDCLAGAAGDMIAAAMLDAGLDAEFLKRQLATLGLEGLRVDISETKRAGFRAIQFVPVEMEEHHHGHHHHHHRGLDEIRGIIKGSGITENAKATAVKIFERLGQAEAAVHGISVNDIHFHEVGAVDAIVDIVSAAVGLDALGIEKVYCSPLSVGGGMVKAAHGILPVPAPATAELIKNVPTRGGPIDKELLTPTGAAILTTVSSGFGELPAMKIEKVGYGAGTLDAKEFPNVVRLLVGEAVDSGAADVDTVCLLETNIDDISGEVIASAMERLLAAGALDVFTTAINMKHNRPAVKLSVLCQPPDVNSLERIIFEAGVTFGIRRQDLRRSKLAREFVTVDTPYGRISIKMGMLDGRVVNAKPEFADCAAAAEKHKTAVKTVIDAAMKAYSTHRH